MEIKAVKRAVSYLLPAVILIATAFSLPMLSSLPKSRHELLVAAPYLMSAVGMALAIHFHRGRPFFILLLHAAFYWCYRTFLLDDYAGPHARQILHACALFIPFNFVYFAYARERGIVTEGGMKRLGMLAGQIVLAYWLFNYNYVDFEPLITGGYAPGGIFESFAVPLPLALVTLACFSAVAVIAVLRHTPPVEYGMLGSMAALFIACNWIQTPDLPASFCTAGALIVTLGILQDSYNMAFRDELSGLPSRRSLNESLYGLGRNYTIAMVDIDHFKKFNDTYGHDVGDQVIRLVAKKMAGVGGKGRAFRYGGEEFTVLFPGRRLEETMPHLEELRRTIAEYRMTIRGDKRPKESRQGKQQRGKAGGENWTSVTVSIGVAESGGARETPEAVMKAADKALYKAKEKGRNQVCH